MRAMNMWPTTYLCMTTQMFRNDNISSTLSVNSATHRHWKSHLSAVGPTRHQPSQGTNHARNEYVAHNLPLHTNPNVQKCHHLPYSVCQ